MISRLLVEDCGQLVRLYFFVSVRHWFERLIRIFHYSDPPKAIPDVVEALIGAAHVDLGFELGQRAALNVIEPIRQSISSILVSAGSLEVVLHPKQHLYELTSGIVRVRAHKSERCDRLGIRSSSLTIDPDGYTGVVSCKGLIIATVGELRAYYTYLSSSLLSTRALRRPNRLNGLLSM